MFQPFRCLRISFLEIISVVVPPCGKIVKNGDPLSTKFIMSVMRAPRQLSAGNIYRTGVAFQSWVISDRPNESRVTVEVGVRV